MTDEEFKARQEKVKNFLLERPDMAHDCYAAAVATTATSREGANEKDKTLHSVYMMAHAQFLLLLEERGLIKIL